MVPVAGDRPLSLQDRLFTLLGHASQQEAHPEMEINSLSGYDAPATALLFAGSVEGASNPTYGDFYDKTLLPTVGWQAPLKFFPAPIFA